MLQMDPEWASSGRGGSGCKDEGPGKCPVALIALLLDGNSETTILIHVTHATATATRMSGSQWSPPLLSCLSTPYYYLHTYVLTCDD